MNGVAFILRGYPKLCIKIYRNRRKVKVTRASVWNRTKILHIIKLTSLLCPQCSTKLFEVGFNVKDVTLEAIDTF